MSNETADILKWASTDGHFRRQQSSFRNFITKDSEFTPEKGRYHLYVSYACPWAHRTLILRELKGLQDIIDVSVVSPHMGEDGWPFASADQFPGATTDPINDSKHVKDLYFRANSQYGGRFTVPVLWDKQTGTIVNNESSEIIRIFNTAFNDLIPSDKQKLDYYPEELQPKIDELNEWVYEDINNGVYRSGFATTQEAYQQAVSKLFDGLDSIEKILDGKDYLVGDRLTEADIRLYTTIVRFDPVYHGHFKCNLGSIRHDYPNINRWLKNLYWNNDSFKKTTNFEHIKVHYYWSHAQINPTKIVPLGPKYDIEALN